MTAEAIVLAAGHPWHSQQLRFRSLKRLSGAGILAKMCPCRQQRTVCLRCDFGPPSVLSLHTLIHIRDDELKLFQSADISRNRLDLPLVEAMCNRAHNGRSVGLCGILAALCTPVGQRFDDVEIELASQSRNLAAAGGVRSVTRGACCDVFIGHPVLEDFLASLRELLRRAAKRWRIERAKICGKSRDHRLAQRMRYVEHHVVCSSMLDESLQLILQIYGLLSGEARYGVIAMETLRRNAMADFAILKLGLNFLFRDGTLPRVLRPAGSRKGNSSHCCGPDQC
jgi:hypothetical protein